MQGRENVLYLLIRGSLRNKTNVRRDVKISPPTLIVSSDAPSSSFMSSPAFTVEGKGVSDSVAGNTLSVWYKTC